MIELRKAIEQLREKLMKDGWTSPGISDPLPKTQAGQMGKDCYPLLLFLHWMDNSPEAIEFLDNAGIGWADPTSNPNATIPSLAVPTGADLPTTEELMSSVVSEEAKHCPPFMATLGTGETKMVRLLEVIGPLLKVQAFHSEQRNYMMGTITMIKIEAVSPQDRDRVREFVSKCKGAAIQLESEEEITRGTIGINPVNEVIDGKEENENPDSLDSWIKKATEQGNEDEE